MFMFREHYAMIIINCQGIFNKSQFGHTVTSAENMETRKRTEVIQQIATYFLTLEKESVVDSIRTISKTLNASIGLISEAITEIEKAGGVILEKRGQLGSFITDMSVGKLWQIARGEPLVIAHTLPSNHRYEGFATALKTALEDAGLETYFIFIRGSRTRINALREKRCHIAITSLFAAHGLREKTEDITKVFPPCSFTSAHHLYLRSAVTRDQNGLVVGIDPDSFDQMHLSKIEFKNADVRFQHFNFMNIYRYLSSGAVDAAIWTEDDMRPHLGDTVRELALSERTRSIAREGDSQAALVTRSNDPLTQEVIKKTIKANAIIAIQNEVIEGKRIPAY